jgi:hypothetical protein
MPATRRCCSSRIAVAPARPKRGRALPVPPKRRWVNPVPGRFPCCVRCSSRERTARRGGGPIVADVEADGADRAAVIMRDVAAHERTLKDLQAEQLHLVGLSYKELVSDEVLAQKQREIEREKLRVAALLAQANEHAEDVDAELLAVLDRTRTPYTTYKLGTPLERCILNQAFFKQLFIGEDGEVLGATLTAPYAAVAAWDPGLGRPCPTGRQGARPDRERASADVPRPEDKTRPPFCGARVCTSVKWWTATARA